jgi:hypothetical protein
MTYKELEEWAKRNDARIEHINPCDKYHYFCIFGPRYYIEGYSETREGYHTKGEAKRALCRAVERIRNAK